MADMELEMVNLASFTQLPSSNILDTKRVLRRLVLKLEVFGSLGGFSMVFHIYIKYIYIYELPYNVRPPSYKLVYKFHEYYSYKYSKP